MPERFIEEAALLKRVSEGDRDAYARLYTKYVPRLYRFVYPFVNHSKEDAEEVVQEVFLKIWMRKGTLANVRSFESYVFRMAKNQLFDHRRLRLMMQNAIHGLYLETIVSSAHENLVYKEYYQAVLEAIRRLSPQRKKIFEMRTGRQMPIDEIAATLRISRSAVKKQLYEAIRFVKSYLYRHHNWPLLLLVPCFFFEK